jgi:hypothetical protein
MICFRNISVDTLHKGNTEDDDDDDNDNDDDNNNNSNNNEFEILGTLGCLMFTLNVEIVLPLDGLWRQMPSAVMLV